ncbi:MAG: nuclease-related domain-containing protein [Deferrisomatales bacterium]|nr:nuclease-related domain-containing protein [Deferrisomatales bacterium]
MAVPFELLLALSGVPIGFGSLYIRRWQTRRAVRRTPLTRELLRAPGESLASAVDVASERVTDEALLILLWPLLVTFIATVFFYPKGGMTDGRLVATALVCLSGVGIGVYRLLSRLKERDRLRLGLDGERAVGEELNQLMLKGCRVFHDVLGERFNIDHVVVGPAGVWAVETKARAKKGKGKDSARVTCDGQHLRFPGWTEKEPLEQAQRQAVWLGKWLTSAVGEPVVVRSALALPGWFVERKAPADPVVFNPRNSAFLADPRGGVRLPDPMIQRIAHQLEQRCRNVAPRAYGETGG